MLYSSLTSWQLLKNDHQWNQSCLAPYYWFVKNGEGAALTLWVERVTGIMPRDKNKKISSDVRPSKLNEVGNEKEEDRCIWCPKTEERVDAIW